MASVSGMGDSTIEIRRWTRLEYERLADAEILGSLDRIELLDGHMVVKEPQASPYRDPMPDAGAAFGWRYGRTLALGQDEHVSPLAAPAATIPVAELLP